jgi:hypothetical protein
VSDLALISLTRATVPDDDLPESMLDRTIPDCDNLSPAAAASLPRDVAYQTGRKTLLSDCWNLASQLLPNHYLIMTIASWSLH